MSTWGCLHESGPPARLSPGFLLLHPRVVKDSVMLIIITLWNTELHAEDVGRGVPQGPVLGLSLFSSSMFPLLQKLNKINKQINKS